MRRLSLRLALVAAALLCGPLPLLAQQRAPAVRGDVNGDGRITSADALAVMAFLRGRTLPANFDVPGRGDADGDGVITRADAERITRLAVGKEVSAELPGAPGNAARLECVANVQSRTVQCAQPGSRGAGTALADRIVYGGQNQYVTLTSSNVTVSGDIFAFDVTVRNLIRQPIGTNDGVTADPNGVQVLFANGVQNTTPGGSGSIQVINEDGTGVFTGSDQEYFKYVGILARNQVSAPRNWQLQFDPGVQSFKFQLYVSSPVQFPQGYVVVTPAADTVFVGGTVQLTDSVRTAVDNPIPGQTVTWSTSDTAIATVSSSGLVTAAGAGVATITATNTRGDTIRTGTATITVLGTPAAYRVTASDSTPAVRDSIIVSAQLVDGNGDPVPAAGRTVTWSTSTTGTFASPTSTTDAAGVATTKFYTDSVATTATLTATEGALSGSVTITTGASAASTARSTITASPDTLTADGAATSTITVQLIDAFGNALTTSGGTVTLSTTSGTLSAVTDNGNGTYTATLTAPATVGSATVTGAIDGNPIADNATVTFIAGAAAKLSITTQPSDTARSGTAFARQPVIQLQDASGNAVAQAGVTVTAAIASGAGTLGGTVTATTDANGTATFTDLLIAGATGDRTLSFSATGLTSATSNTVTITAGALHHFLVEAAAGGPIGNQQTGVAFNVRVTAQDSLNNTVTSFTGTVNFTSTPAGGISAGGTSGAFTGGVLASHSITFGTPGSYTLTATRAGGTESGTSNAFEVQSPPSATADGPAAGSAPGAPYHAFYSTSATPQTFTLAAPGVLANDNLGFPAAAITSFGADSLGGTVTTYAAGSTVSPLPGTGRTTGSLSVGANGSITFTPPDGFTGNYVFKYRLSNARGFVDAQVTIAVGARPAAAADTYSPVLVGNVPINTATSTQFRVTTNDAGDAKVLSASSPTNGTVTLNQNGTFTFRPTRGFEGTASFSYTVANGFGTTAPVTVTLTVGAPVYFVDASAAAGGDGVYDARYNSLANLAAANNGTGTNPAANDRIFLYSGSYAAPLTLLAGQRLVGQGATGASFSAAVGVTWPADSGPEPTINGTSPTITSAGTGLTLGSGNTLNGFNLGTVATGAALTGTSFGTLTVTNVGINTTGQALSLTTGTLTGGFTQLRSTGGTNNVFLSGVATTGTSTLGVAGDVLSGATGDAVVVAGGTGSFTFPANITQASNAATLNVNGGHSGTLTFAGTIGATNGTGLQFNNADGTYSFTGTPTLNGGNAGIDVTNGSSGTFTFPATASITNPTSETIVISNSAPTFTYPGSLTKTNNAASGITLSGNTGGTIAFSGATKVFSTATATAVNLVTNTGTTISFADSLRITTTSGIGFNATGGGTVSVAGTHNSITSAGGIAANVVSTTIGAGGMNFRSISATGGTNGIVLNNVGNNGFVVTGDGASDAANTTRGRTTARSGGGTLTLGSGGTITATTGKAVLLNTVGNVVLRNLTIQNNGSAGADSTRAGISAAAVTGLEIDNVLVSGQTGNYGLRVGASSNVTITHSQFLNNATTAGVEATDIWNVRLDDMGGTSTVRHSLFQNSREMTLGWYQTGTSNGTVNVTNAEFSGTTAGNGVNVGLFNSATANLSVIGSRIQNNSSTGLQYASNDAAGGSVTVQQDTLEQNTVDVSLAHQGAARTLDYTVSNNVMRQQFKSGSSNSINVYLGGTSTASSLMRGTISGNVVGAAGVANSGSDLGRGIYVEAAGAGTGTAVVTNNIVRQIKQESAFYGQVAKGTATAATSPRLNLTITGNDLQVNTASGSALAGVELTAGTIPNINDNPTMCVNMQSNTAFVGQPTFAGVYVVTSGFTGSGTSANPTVELQGYTGAANNLAQIEAFLGSSARATTNTPAPILARTTGTVRASTAACPTS